jgi:hypothetical protein
MARIARFGQQSSIDLGRFSAGFVRRERGKQCSPSSLMDCKGTRRVGLFFYAEPFLNVANLSSLGAEREPI